MALSKEELEESIKILKALDEAIASGPWEYNLLFRGIGQKLREMRERFVKELKLEELTAEPIPITDEEAAKFTEVYVSLYQAEGNNISKWQIVVNSLAGYNVTRPVYENEEHIQKAIKTKEFRQNDAYVVVKISKEDIMPPLSEKPPVDKHGHTLLVLREGAIKLENILRFSHLSGEYDYREGVLIKRVPK